MRTWSKRLSVLLAGVAVIGLATGCMREDKGNTKAHQPTEVVDQDETLLTGADPKVLRAKDGTYYLYTSESTWHSTDLKKWESIDSAISRAAYVYTKSEDDSKTQRLWSIWAPYVFELNGEYVMVASGYVSADMPIEESIHRSLFASRSKSPAGPFEKFYRVLPRKSDHKAPHSVLNVPTDEERNASGFDEKAVMTIDAAVFHDPKSKKDYMAYVSYGSPDQEEQNGNHIQLFSLNGAKFEEGDQPGFYYDFDPADSFEIADPQKWPEFDVPMNLEKTNSPWHPSGGEWGELGYARYINEAPALFYDKGWYHFYFSVNTWDSPSYQILEVRAKHLKDLRADTRGQVKSKDIRFSIFQAPSATNNFGSGSVIQAPKGNWVYFMHALIPDSERTIWRKEIDLD